MKANKFVKTFEEHTSEFNISSVSDSFIDSVKKEMLDWYGFDLTYEQVKEYIESNKLEVFDTWERGDFGHFLAKKITGMEWPMNADSEEYKHEFYRKLKENSQKMGYKWG